MKLSSMGGAAIVCGATVAMVLPATAATATESGLSAVTVVSSFAPYGPDVTASTYAPELVPVGSHVVVSSLSKHSSTVLLGVRGLVPNREYGAHVHQKPCGPDPADAGPHFQNVPDPVTPSVDPAYANPANEVWLDFTTDATGSAVVVARQDWGFQGRPAGSLVIHESHTHTDHGHAGMAGARLACVSATF